MRTNVQQTVTTHQGGPSQKVSAYEELRRTVLSCLLWEDNFYEDGESVSKRIEKLSLGVSPEQLGTVISEAAIKYRLRHVPLFLTVQALKKGNVVGISEFITSICCTRPDQMSELISLYWKDGKKPLPNQLKKGLAKSFLHFDEYQLAKYDRDTPIKLRDVMFLCHPKPKNEEQQNLWKKLANRELTAPDTWEVRLSAGKDKKSTFTDLLTENKLGKLALIRNLRNMHDSGVSKELVKEKLLRNKQQLLPFQFIAAAKECPTWEDIVDESMIESMASYPKLKGNTSIFVDVSGSMDHGLSGKSKMNRMDAACGIAMLLREVCENVEVLTFSEALAIVPNRRGMALRDAIVKSQMHSGTYLGKALQCYLANGKPIERKIDRVVVITDEQVADAIPQMPMDKCYIINVGTNQNGIKTDRKWHHINGFSEASVTYITELESLDQKE